MAAFHAKYKGQCTQCGRWHIAPGDLIIPHPDGGYARPSCMMEAGTQSNRDDRQRKYREAKKIRKLTENTSTLPIASRYGPSPCEKIAANIALLAKQPPDPLHPGGIEVFY